MKKPVSSFRQILQAAWIMACFLGIVLYGMVLGLCERMHDGVFPGKMHGFSH